MGNTGNGGCLAILMIIVPISTWLGTGYMAWNWIEPESFWGAIKFLIAWGVLGYLAQIIGALIVAGIAGMSE